MTRTPEEKTRSSSIALSCASVRGWWVPVPTSTSIRSAGNPPRCSLRMIGQRMPWSPLYGTGRVWSEITIAATASLLRARAERISSSSGRAAIGLSRARSTAAAGSPTGSGEGIDRRSTPSSSVRSRASGPKGIVVRCMAPS